MSPVSTAVTADGVWPETVSKMWRTSGAAALAPKPDSSRIAAVA